ncbi:LuxR family transcriptional regulator [Ramlibacter sp. USB13]|uniref:LuxR family transcriptional regulator n=1 Tax=Ramlibacter cellulosilyticus TaxID=2764187 RepID=A0A923MPZ9_9BURK|nr:LuxR C-terminal-related transcriptional regulator [Ramlibacter cellulosilyticus]MBC5782089.1 LuxR family transcriptional regulator [Ramlibacter cellulosilyticus]
MRKWTTAPATSGAPGQALAPMIDALGQPGFPGALLAHVHPLVPAASFSVYQIGSTRAPRLFMSATRGVPDRTRDCWRAYISGPHREDRSLESTEGTQAIVLCHVDAGEVPREHRVLVYEAHGMAERISAVQREPDGALFALNLYRHLHQQAFTDAQVAAFEQMAPALVALARKHVALMPAPPDERKAAGWRRQLRLLAPDLTDRELDVCERLLRGMTHEGVAADLRLGLATVKTYRNRAFGRLGIHFRSELFALLAARAELH